MSQTLVGKWGSAGNGAQIEKPEDVKSNLAWKKAFLKLALRTKVSRGLSEDSTLGQVSYLVGVP